MIADPEYAPWADSGVRGSGRARPALVWERLESFEGLDSIADVPRLGSMVVAATKVNVFRSRWDVELVAQASLGVDRFDDFHLKLGISRQVLAHRMKELVAERILVRQQYQTRPARFEYTPTAKGRDLLPIVVAMAKWSERWRPHAANAELARLLRRARTAAAR